MQLSTRHVFPLLASLGFGLPLARPAGPSRAGELPTFWLGAGYAGAQASGPAATWAVADAADQASCAAYVPLALDCGAQPYVAVAVLGAAFCGARPFGIASCSAGALPSGPNATLPLFDARDGAVVGTCASDLASLQGKACEGLSYQTWLRCAVYEGFC